MFGFDMYIHLNLLLFFYLNCKGSLEVTQTLTIYTLDFHTYHDNYNFSLSISWSEWNSINIKVGIEITRTH